MELRVLKYFKAVADAGSITDAAKALHVTQPTLSRQLSQLETELGTVLLTRGKAGIGLTDQGVILYRYAESIIALADKAEEEVAAPSSAVSGVVHIGAGETQGFSCVARTCANMRKKYPNVSFDIHDGNSAILWDGFVRGQYDILLDCDSGPNADFNQIELPMGDCWGVVMRSDDPLASLKAIGPKDLEGRDVIVSGQSLKRSVSKWAGPSLERMEVASTYGLPLNSRLLVEEGVGIMLAYGGLVDQMASERLCFRPLEPKLEARHKILWRKTLPSKQTQVFLEELKALIALADHDSKAVDGR